MKSQSDNFINIEYRAETLDIYFQRTGILKAIKDNLINFSGNLLDVGCGKMPYKDYILKNSSITKYTGIDIETALLYDQKVKPDFTWDGNTLPFENESFDTVIATEVLEHCPDPFIIFNETNRVLKKNGVFFFTVPFLWNLHEVPHDEFRYTPFSLNRMLTKCDFTSINLYATGGWHASMAQMLGLWVKRAPMQQRRRRVLTAVLKPIIKNLYKLDRHSKVTFTEGDMITGIYGTAYKR